MFYMYNAEFLLLKSIMVTDPLEHLGEIWGGEQKNRPPESFKIDDALLPAFPKHLTRIGR